MAMVSQTIDHGRGHWVIGKHGPPLGQLQMGGENETPGFVTVGDDAKEQRGSGAINGQIAPFIQDQQVGPLSFHKKPF